jgi:hypothetical protein
MSFSKAVFLLAMDIRFSIPMIETSVPMEFEKSIIGPVGRLSHVSSVACSGPPRAIFNACATNAEPTPLSLKDAIELGGFVAMQRGIVLEIRT